MKMQLAERRRERGGWQPKSIGAPGAFGFDHPERELRKPIFHIRGVGRSVIEMKQSTRFGYKLLCHQGLSARHSFPIDVTL